ncbi:MAG: tetratricopeptide repeat protein, partial [Candidatus Dadabacteria bacterium]|nr:tetratricopeptide repeat protein [Candidatus Dadabacteria bacterium]
YLIAKSAVTRSLALVIMWICIIVILITPYTGNTVSERFEIEGEGSPHLFYFGPNGDDNDSIQFNFTSRDTFNTVESRTLTVDIPDSEDSIEVNITLINNGVRSTLQRETNVSDDNPLRPVRLDSYSSKVEFIVELNNPHDYCVNGSYEYSVEYVFSPILSRYIPLLGICFVVIQLISMSVMYPLRELYASSSIYSDRYVEERKKGEYVLERKLTNEEKKEEALLEGTLAIPEMRDKKLPPPPPPEEKKEMARKKGEVDSGLVREPDVPCNTCGCMNSPHAAVCFSCGNMLAEEKEEAFVDTADILKKGWYFLDSGNHVSAIQFFDEVLKKDPMCDDAMLGKGIALNKKGDWETAVQYINTVLSLYPKNLRALVEKAKIFESRGREDKALPLYDEILAIEPDNPFAKERKEKILTPKDAAPVVKMEAPAATPATAGNGGEEADDSQAIIETFSNLPG